MSSGWIVQGRVIMALILREVHTLYGSSRLGYLWAVIQTMFGIGIFWGIREIAGARAPHGMSVLMFLLAGFGLWATFSETLTKCMSAVSGNKALLTFPQVTPLDLMLSRTVVVWGTQLSSGCVITGIAAFCGTSLYVSDWTGLFAAFLLTPLLGLGCGMLCASLAVFWPTLEKIVPMILRILFFASGIFFSVSMFPKNIADTRSCSSLNCCVRAYRADTWLPLTITSTLWRSAWFRCALADCWSVMRARGPSNDCIA